MLTVIRIVIRIIERDHSTEKKDRRKRVNIGSIGIESISLEGRKRITEIREGRRKTVEKGITGRRKVNTTTEKGRGREIGIEREIEIEIEREKKIEGVSMKRRESKIIKSTIVPGQGINTHIPEDELL